MNRKTLATAVTIVTLGVTAVVATSASAEQATTVAIVANNDIDGPVAQTAVHFYEQHGALARRYGVDTPNVEVLGGHDCVLFVGRDAHQMKNELDLSGEADGVTIAVQGWERYATASQVVHPDTVEACIG